MRKYLFVLIFSCLSLFHGVSLAAERDQSSYKIGVYYFPGWVSGAKGASSSDPWRAILPYPEREPMLGWYDNSSVSVLDQQLGWMSQYGIGFVVFDWYWNGRKTFLEQGLLAYLKAPNRSKVPFSLLWANHDAAPKSKSEFTAMVRFWAEHYFSRPEFLRVDGHPVVFVFSHDQLASRAAGFGESEKSLIEEAQAIMSKSGSPSIYFVSSTYDKGSPVESGYSAVSTYNYHGLSRPSESYLELDSVYRQVWAFRAGRGSTRYIVPMTSGWDRRPWGGSNPPAHDNSRSTAAEFESHLLAAKRLMNSRSSETSKMGVICCWNEFGEGSYIEPTKKDGFSYLEKIRKVFGSGAKQ